MESARALELNGFGLVSIIEHSMFAILPGWLAVLLAPLLSSKSCPVAPLQLSGSASKPVVPSAVAMLLFQILAIFVRSASPSGSSASIPAAILSLATSLLVCVVLWSRYALSSRPALPFQLLGVTLIYEACAAWHFHTSGQRSLWKVYTAITTFKSTFMLLSLVTGRRCLQKHLSAADDEADSFLSPIKRVFAWSHKCCNFVLASGSRTKSPHVLLDRFMYYWKSGELKSIRIHAQKLRRCSQQERHRCFAQNLHQCIILVPFLLPGLLLLSSLLLFQPAHTATVCHSRLPGNRNISVHGHDSRVRYLGGICWEHGAYSCLCHQTFWPLTTHSR